MMQRVSVVFYRYYSLYSIFIYELIPTICTQPSHRSFDFIMFFLYVNIECIYAAIMYLWKLVRPCFTDIPSHFIFYIVWNYNCNFTAITCDVPTPSDANLQLTLPSLAVNASVHFSCVDGYQLMTGDQPVQNASQVCSNQQEWVGKEPWCKRQ